MNKINFPSLAIPQYNLCFSSAPSRIVLVAITALVLLAIAISIGRIILRNRAIRQNLTTNPKPSEIPKKTNDSDHLRESMDEENSKTIDLNNGRKKSTDSIDNDSDESTVTDSTSESDESTVTDSDNEMEDFDYVGEVNCYKSTTQIRDIIETQISEECDRLISDYLQRIGLIDISWLEEIPNKGLLVKVRSGCVVRLCLVPFDIDTLKKLIPDDGYGYFASPYQGEFQNRVRREKFRFTIAQDD